MPLDRRIAPPINTITKLQIPIVEQITLANGMQLSILNQGTQGVLKIEIFHRAGRSAERHKLVSRATASLIKEGSHSYSSNQVADTIDYYGSSIKTSANMDFAYISVHTMTKHFEKLVPLMTEMLTVPIFPESELAQFSRINAEKLKEELAKNEIISYRTLTEAIFGADHPYGYNSVVEDYQSLSRDHIIDHFDNLYGTNNAYIFVAGQVTDEAKNLIIKNFEQINRPVNIKPYVPSIVPLQHQLFEQYTSNEHQSSLKIGRRLFDKHHPDNANVFLLNTLLGGYFGSRLMTNIREEKGYTYDISSSIDHMLYDGYFSISSETAPKYVEPMIGDIYAEILKLQQDPIEDKEMTMVKNYLVGNFMSLLDGPLNAISFVKTMVLTGQNLDNFQLFIDEILDLTSQDINNTAQKYLKKEDMIHAIVYPQKLQKGKSKK
jgi:zinc protease